MKRNLLSEIYDIYEIENNSVNRNNIKCILSSMHKKGLASVEGQIYVYDEETFSWLVALYKKLSWYFDFFYSLKSDLVQMYIYLIESRQDNVRMSFNAFFCPGYDSNGGYKDYLGNTTTRKLKILDEVTKSLNDENIPHIIHCYYCDSFIENCDDKFNSNWYNELLVNRKLFKTECKKYFDDESIHYISELDVFKGEKSYAGHIDFDIINRVPKKVYRSFFIANEVFYKKLNFSSERIQERNDILATMYIMVSDYINRQKNGIYLPMENMYDREKIIANNGTCTMYLRQGLVKKDEQ